jgi:Tol biopolymer transport system component
MQLKIIACLLILVSVFFAETSPSYSEEIQLPKLSEKAPAEPEIFSFNALELGKAIFSPDGRYILMYYEKGPAKKGDSGHGATLGLWDLSAGKMVKTFNLEDRDLFSFSPDGKHIITDSHVFEVETGRKIFDRYSDAQADYWGYCTTRIAVSPDGKFAFCGIGGNENYSATLWNVKTGKATKHFKGHGVSVVAFSPDGKYILTGSRDYTLTLWDVSTGREIRTFEGHSDWVDAVAFSPDGRYVVSAGEDVRVWDISSGMEIRAFKIPWATEVHSLSFYGGYLHVNIEDSSELTVFILDINTGKEIKVNRFKPGGASIDDGNGIAFSPDGRYVLFAESFQKFGKTLLDMETGEKIVTMGVIGIDGDWAIYTPEGYFNASENAAEYLKIKMGRNTYSINNFYDRYYNPAVISQKLRGIKVTLPHDIRKGVESPPKVIIVNQGDIKPDAEGVVEIIIEAQDTGGGIDEVRLFHNDSAIGENTDNVKIKRSTDKLEKKYQVRLVQGENVLKAVGFSNDRTESKPYLVTVNYEAVSKETRLYLVTIGINNYKNPDLKLNLAVADARGLKDFFEKNWKPLFSEFHVAEIYDKDATKKTIMKIMSELKAREQDVVIVYLAGHGLNLGDEWYFVPYDVVYPERENDLKELGISAGEMAQMIRSIRALKKVIFIDSCKSGSIFLATARAVEERRSITQLARSTGTHVVAATTDKQYAMESYNIGHGIFTYALLQGLAGEAKNSDATVTIRELIAYVENALPQITMKYRLIPQYPVIDSRGQDFPLAVKRQ